MESGNIQITQILGNDSISSSRIVINDNFKILAHELNNYKQYFNENGVYSSIIISKNEEGTIDFKVDEYNSKMRISGESVDINGNLNVFGNLTLDGSLIYSPVSSQTLSNFTNNTSNLGYIECYGNGQIIKKEETDNKEIYFSTIKKLLNNADNRVLQYSYRPILIIGNGIYVSYESNDNFDNVASTNCKIYSENNKFYLTPAAHNTTTIQNSFNVIRIYPIVYGTESYPEYRIRIEM